MASSVTMSAAPEVAVTTIVQAGTEVEAAVYPEVSILVIVSAA